MSTELDKVEQCRNCKQWKNKDHLCMGNCTAYKLPTYANGLCAKFSFGKRWSERVKEWDKKRSVEPLGNMPFIDNRGAPDI